MIRPHYLIWDFDGTLAERQGGWSGALAETAAQAGVAAEREAIRPFLGMGYPWHTPHVIRPAAEPPDRWWQHLQPVFVRAFKEGLGLPAARARALAEQVREVYLQPQHWHLFDDTLETLQALTAVGWRHVILSNHVPELPQLVEQLNLGSHFEHVFCSGRTGIEKPHPQAFALVRQWCGTNAELRMIGDSWRSDVCGATAQGIPAVLVRQHHPESACSCTELAELPALLESMEQASVDAEGEVLED